MTATPQPISVDRIFLDLDNPRHERYRSQSEVIDYLCKNEAVYTLAKDMARIGLNPLELFALIPLDAKEKGRSLGVFVVAEGNRRMCAIKLLHDPELAPANLRKDFRALAESPRKFSDVLAIVFDDTTQLELWLERIHGGPQGGIGRKPWNSEQKTRHLGNRKNVLAQAVLDYAEVRGFISTEQRKGKLTTAQRYLGNKILREAMGIESANTADVSRNRPQEDFDIILKTFVNDLVEGRVSSRSNSDAITAYSRALSELDGVSGSRVAAASLTASTTRGKKRSPKEPRRPKSIAYEEDIAKALKHIGSYKLEKLYFSICELPLEKHTPLISIGVWAFFETLTALSDRDSNTAFPSFLSNQRLASLGFDGREEKAAITQALNRISAYGNTTKHHDTAANFNGEQIANDMATLRELVVKLTADLQK